LLRNEGGNRNNWLRIKLVGTRSNRDGIGARVHIMAEGDTQVAEVKSGSSYASCSDKRLLFGLGQRRCVDGIKIWWPSGIIQELENIPCNQTITITENKLPKK